VAARKRQSSNFRDGGRELVDGCGFSEIEDAVEAVHELVEKAKRLRDGN
jgi:hypothetical protein